MTGGRKQSELVRSLPHPPLAKLRRARPRRTVCCFSAALLFCCSAFLLLCSPATRLVHYTRATCATRDTCATCASCALLPPQLGTRKNMGRVMSVSSMTSSAGRVIGPPVFGALCTPRHATLEQNYSPRTHPGPTQD